MKPSLWQQYCWGKDAIMRIVRWLLIGLITLITAEVALALALVANLPRMSAGEMWRSAASSCGSSTRAKGQP